jgi:hypothetical protein
MAIIVLFHKYLKNYKLYIGQTIHIWHPCKQTSDLLFVLSQSKHFSFLTPVQTNFPLLQKTVKLIFGIHDFWIQHTQIDLKSQISLLPKNAP